MPAVTAARVTVIPAKKDRLPINVLSSEAHKLRVAAYARVSTNNEEQLTSYEAQVGYTEILKALSNFKYKAVMAVFFGALIAGGAEMDWETFDNLFKLDSIEGIREIIVQGVVDALPRDGGDDGGNP